MLKKAHIQLSLFVVSLFLAVTVAYVKFDMFRLMGFQSSNVDKNVSNKLKSQTAEAGKIGETDSPVYFSVFRFVNNFVPAKQEN